MMAPVTVINANSKRETGKKAQLGNIAAGKAVAEIIRTTLGPRSMQKMILDANNGIVLTNDGHAILREMDVSHPAAKSIIELSRTQDEEVGDGTTSVIILAGEFLSAAEPLLAKNLHPTVIVRGYHKALEDTLAVLEREAFTINVEDRDKMRDLVMSCVGTKFTHRFGTLMADLALDAVHTVAVRHPNGMTEVDLKKYAKVEKIPGGAIEDSRVLKGVMFNKDVVLPGRMRRKIRNPRIILLDCPLEYKKGENQTNVELTREEDFAAMLKLEEEWTLRVCNDILKHKPDLVVTEKGLSDLAAHFLVKAGVSAIRRIRKTDNNRIARACGATVVHRPEEIQDRDVGTGAGLFDVQKIGDEYFSFVMDCKEPKACSIVLRGASKDILNEVERNLTDALGVARNVMLEPKLIPGGGAVEMAAARYLMDRASSVAGPEQWAYRAVAAALEVIPRTLAQNCGANVIRTLTKLKAEHTKPGVFRDRRGARGRGQHGRARGVGADAGQGADDEDVDRGGVHVAADRRHRERAAEEAGARAELDEAAHGDDGRERRGLGTAARGVGEGGVTHV
ncbi:unnamed protein product [Pedinophyceae sp. YPF-701]|nr:unnamed protein product [Pedinophyceae sp. YPF-701]